METNPLDPSEALHRPPPSINTEEAHPQPVFPEDSAVTKAEKLERYGPGTDANDYAEPPTKRVRLDGDEPVRIKGMAPIKAEYGEVLEVSCTFT